MQIILSLGVTFEFGLRGRYSLRLEPPLNARAEWRKGNIVLVSEAQKAMTEARW